MIRPRFFVWRSDSGVGVGEGEQKWGLCFF